MTSPAPAPAPAWACTLADLVALLLFVLAAVVGWAGWNIMTNGRFEWDARRGLSLAVGLLTVGLSWGQYLLVRPN